MRVMNTAHAYLVAVLFAGIFSNVVRADSPAAPTPRITASEDGRFAFILTPGEEDWRGDKSRGIAYELTSTGELREIWRTEGWYSFQTFLALDGHHLVRMGPWNEGDSPKPDDLAVAFYRDGKLLKSHSTASLVRDHSRVVKSASHYQWLAEYPMVPRLGWDGDFRLTTIDGIEYRFDVTTGEIKSAETESTRSKGWASPRDIDRVLLAIQFADRPFRYADLVNHIGLPSQTRELSVGYGQGHRSQVLGLNYASSPYVGYALEIEVKTPAGAPVRYDGAIEGDVTALRLLYYTPDDRRLSVTASGEVERIVARVKAGSSQVTKTPSQLADEVLGQLNGRNAFAH